MSKSEKPLSSRVMSASAPFSTPESLDALSKLKEFVRVNTPAGKIEAHAFRLVGESQETIDRETHELFEALRQQSPPLRRRGAFGFAFASARRWSMSNKMKNKTCRYSTIDNCQIIIHINSIVD
jgi:hypothetical protein